VPRWFAWLLLAMVLLSVGGMAAVLWAAEVTLSWQANTESDLAGYKIYQSTISGQYSAPVMTVGKVTTQTVTLPQLDIATTYFFVLTAYDLAGNESQQSLEVSKTIVGLPATAPPGVPVLTVTASSPTEFDITWPTISDGAGGVAQVDIRLGSPTDHWGLMVSQACPSSPCRVTGLIGGTAYQVQAVAYRTEATSNIFGALSAPIMMTTTVPDLPPAQPQGLTIASASADSVVIVASAAACKKILTTITGTTQTQHRRTLTCVRP
jgi:hypothetical protein